VKFMGSVASCLAHQSIPGGSLGRSGAGGRWWSKPLSLLGEGKEMVDLTPVASQDQEQNLCC